MGTNKRIVCENSAGQQMEFKYSMPYWLTSVDGIHKYEGKISSVQSAFSVGENYTGTTIGSRNIVIKGNVFDDFKARREALEKVFILRDQGTFYYYEDDMERKIDYHVESFEFAEHGMPREFEISLICSNPYFSDLAESLIKISQWENLFVFPLIIPEGVGKEFATRNQDQFIYINNETSIELGLNITFNFSELVSGIKITNAITGDVMEIEGTFTTGEQLIIETSTNNKRIYYIDDSGNKEDITYRFAYGSTWLTAPAKTNSAFKPTAEVGAENMTCQVTYMNYYEGV